MATLQPRATSVEQRQPSTKVCSVYLPIKIQIGCNVTIVKSRQPSTKVCAIYRSIIVNVYEAFFDSKKRKVYSACRIAARTCGVCSVRIDVLR